MALYLAVGVGLVAWPLISRTFPNMFSQIPVGSTHTSKNNDIINPRLSTFIEHTLALENITGLSVAVVPNPGAPEFHAWGHRTEDRDKVTPETLFYMASVSKAFCATALGLLIDDYARGDNVTALPPGLAELSWHTRLRDLLPDAWTLMDTWASERANVRDVLAHVSGLAQHDASYGPSDTPLEMTVRLRYLRPAFELREQWSYNNIMYMVVAHVIERYAGCSYTSFVEERIFAPLGMTSSTFSPAKAKASGKLTQGWNEQGRRLPECFTEEAAFMMAGPGGIISNAVDMARWISTWIGQGVHEGQTIIPASVYRNVSFSYSVSADHPTDPQHSIVGYGLGWFRSAYRGHDIVYHFGAFPGLSTLVTFLPSDGIGVTLFTNGESKAEALTLILNRVLDSVLHLTSSPTEIPTSSPSRNVTTTVSNPRNSTVSLDVFAGTYANPGYGSFTLCGPSSTSSYCARVQSDFAIVDGVNPHQELLAEWPRMWFSHVRMRHEQENVFRMYFTSLYPNGYGKDTTPFEMRSMGSMPGVAEFVVEDGRAVGLGMVAECARTSRCERVQDRAEVWFDKV